MGLRSKELPVSGYCLAQVRCLDKLAELHSIRVEVFCCAFGTVSCGHLGETESRPLEEKNSRALQDKNTM